MILASVSNDILAAVGGLTAALSLGIAAAGIGNAIRRGMFRQLRIGGSALEFAHDDEKLRAEIDAAIAMLRSIEDVPDRGVPGSAGGRAVPRPSVASPPSLGETVVRDQGDRSPGHGADGGGAPDPGVDARIGKSEDLLTAYHALGLAQSRVMFWFSVIFASLGFALIALTVVVTVTSPHPTIASGNVVSLISGAIVEAVSALFSVQSNRARALMTAFFDRLRSDQALDRALALADEVPDDLIRSRVKAVLAFSLAQASPGDEVVEMVLGGGGRPQVQSLSSARPEGTSGAARPVKA